MCKKNFGSEVSLKVHMKYAHNNEKLESCSQCDATFKQKKNLRAHLANIHDIDQMRERYCEEKNKDIFKCEQCESEFAYKKTLMFHIKSKHEGNYSVYECDICHSKYSNKQNLAKHVKLKH